MRKRQIYICSLKEDINYKIRVNIENNIITYNNIITNLENEVLESVLIGFVVTESQKHKWNKLMNCIKNDKSLLYRKDESPFHIIKY